MNLRILKHVCHADTGNGPQGIRSSVRTNSYNKIAVPGILVEIHKIGKGKSEDKSEQKPIGRIGAREKNYYVIVAIIQINAP